MSYVTRKGPLFDRRAGEAMRAFLVDAEREVAEEGRDLVVYFGQGSFRYLSSPPTYHWKSRVHVTRSFGNHVVLDDVIYGPWLEGTGSRNKTTRFKGYAMYRRAAQALDRQAHAIAQRVLPLYLKMIGGR